MLNDIFIINKGGQATINSKFNMLRKTNNSIYNTERKKDSGSQFV